jgi:DNA-binding NarL/FixJ family response regulator
VLTTYKGDVLASRALKTGALGYLLKSSLRTDMLAAIRAANEGRRYVQQRWRWRTVQVFDHFRFGRFSGETPTTMT